MSQPLFLFGEGRGKVKKSLSHFETKKFGHGIGTSTEMFFISQSNHAGGGILDLIPCPLLLEGEGELCIALTSLRSA